MIAFSAWHALKGRVAWPLTFQVPRMLRRLITETPGTFILCWNAERQWKRERWPAYRDRPEIWDHAGREDYEAMLEVLGALGVVQVKSDGFEADEVLAALRHRFEGSEPILIRSDDKDFMQLLSGSTRMEGRVRGVVRYSDVKRILGVTPPFVADLLALSGDKVDGIPRILPPAQAQRLIETRGHVRDWIDRDLRLTDSLARAIEAGRDQLRINLELVDLSAEAVGDPPPPLIEGWGDVKRARAIGEQAGIAWLKEPDLGDQFAVLREWGERTRDRLGLY